LLTVGRIRGHRGARGELTVVVPAGEPQLWVGVERVWIGARGKRGAFHAVEASRAYADKLVLKLRGVDDASAAAALAGQSVRVDRGDAPPLPEGRYFAEVLVGLEVRDERGRVLGVVADVLSTRGNDLLRVVRDAPDEAGADERELLIPMAGEIVRRVDEARGVIEVRLPAGLEEVNRGGT
jgi:16S rRNA processing protein RimM